MPLHLVLREDAGLASWACSVSVSNFGSRASRAIRYIALCVVSRWRG